MMCKMPQFEEDETKDCIVTFGTNGWSSYFHYYGKDISYPRLWEFCNRRIPNDVKKLPMNDKVVWIKVFRFESKESLSHEQRYDAITAL